MFSLKQLYSFREAIPTIVKKITPKFIRQKINKKIFPYYFLKTNLKNLPDSNYPSLGDYEGQKKLIEKYDEKKIQTSFMTCPHLTQLLLMKFSSDENFNFLDIGGEKIDFYLFLKKKFKNIKYILFNQKSMMEPFYKIKKEFNYEDLHLIENVQEIFDNKYDFVNFGSCIQYINNYEDLLEKVTNNTNCVFFSGTHLYNSSNEDLKKNIIVQQVHILPTVNYNYFFNRKNFFKIFKDKNFDLIFESQNLTDPVNYDNFRSEVEDIQYSDFLFIKK